MLDALVEICHKSGPYLTLHGVLFKGRGLGAVQECGGGAQCYALLLTVYSAGGGQPSTVQVIEVLICNRINLSWHNLRSICFHPSLLPRHRGASAISWTLIEGDTTGGFSIFYPDSGLDTGNLLLTRFVYTIILSLDAIASVGLQMSVCQSLFRVMEFLLVA